VPSREGITTATYLLTYLTLQNINRFSKLFHCQTRYKISNNTITKGPTTPQIHFLVTSAKVALCIQGYTCVTSPTSIHWRLHRHTADRWLEAPTGSSTENLASTGGRRYGSTHQCLSIHTLDRSYGDHYDPQLVKRSSMSEWVSGSIASYASAGIATASIVSKRIMIIISSPTERSETL